MTDVYERHAQHRHEQELHEARIAEQRASTERETRLVALDAGSVGESAVEAVSMNRGRVCGIVGVAVLFYPGHVCASGAGWDDRYLWVGPTLGATFQRVTGSGASYSAGTQLTAGEFVDPDVWVAAYADGLVNFDGEEWRLSAGPQVGWVIFGADAGYTVVSYDDAARHGLTLRTMVTGGLVQAYVRAALLFGTPSDLFGEVGLTLKVPLLLD